MSEDKPPFEQEIQRIEEIILRDYSHGRVIDRIIVLRAIHLLTEKALSVKETADMLDFRDPYGFSRFFRRMTGSPPARVRRRSVREVRRCCSLKTIPFRKLYMKLNYQSPG